MPKILDDIQNVILNEARKQVLESGYSSMTIRSVAAACKIAIGTIYNYYPSKDVLAAAFMLDDWINAFSRMKEGSEEACTALDSFACIYKELLLYSEKYDVLFKDAAAFKISAGVFRDRHKQLRSQLAGLISEVCEKDAREKNEFLPEFIAEALLAWTTDGRKYDDVEDVLKMFFR